MALVLVRCTWETFLVRTRTWTFGLRRNWRGSPETCCGALDCMCGQPARPAASQGEATRCSDNHQYNLHGATFDYRLYWQTGVTLPGLQLAPQRQSSHRHQRVVHRHRRQAEPSLLGELARWRGWLPDSGLLVAKSMGATTSATFTARPSTTDLICRPV